MAEPLNRRSGRSRKPIVHFDDKIVQSQAPTKPAKPAKSAKPAPKSKKPPTLPTEASLAECDDDVVEELCSQTQDLDIWDNLKAKKKAKATEIARLTTLRARSRRHYGLTISFNL